MPKIKVIIDVGRGRLGGHFEVDSLDKKSIKEVCQKVITNWFGVGNCLKSATQLVIWEAGETTAAASPSNIVAIYDVRSSIVTLL